MHNLQQIMQLIPLSHFVWFPRDQQYTFTWDSTAVTVISFFRQMIKVRMTWISLQLPRESLSQKRKIKSKVQSQDPRSSITLVKRPSNLLDATNWVSWDRRVARKSFKMIQQLLMKLPKYFSIGNICSWSGNIDFQWNIPGAGGSMFQESQGQ